MAARSMDAVASAFSKFFALETATAWSTRLAQRMSRNARRVRDDAEYLFYAGNPLLLWRAGTLFSKGRETIQWIRTSERNDMFYDIGANVGGYAIYASRRCRKIFAFEPEAQNFAVLNRNEISRCAS